MNNGELYKQAFGTLHAPDTVSLTAKKGRSGKPSARDGGSCSSAPAQCWRSALP